MRAERLIFGLLIALLARGTLGQEKRVAVQLSRNEIFAGDSVAYRVQLQNLPESIVPQLQGFDSFRVEGPNRSQGLRTYEDGRQRLTLRYINFDYLLYPKKSGRLTIPAPKIVYGGKTYEGKALSLLVKPASAQDSVALQLSVDKTQVYLTQSFTITLNIFVKQLPGRYQNEDPVRAFRELPELNIRWVEDDELPRGISPKSPWQDWIRQYMTRENRGFSINRINFEGFMSLRAQGAAFQFPSRLVRRPDKDGKQVYYWEYTLKRAFTANRVGEYTIERASLRGMFGKSFDGRGRLLRERVSTFSKAIKVRVSDGPEEGRPDDYVGVIGKITATAAVNPVSLQVGQPMTLVLTLKGTGSLENAIAPELTRIQPIQQNFKVYDSTSKSSTNQKSFTYSLRPKTSKVTEFPAIPMAYFDPEKSAYVTLKTAPIPIEVAVADQLSGSDIIMSKPPSSGDDIEVRKDGIFANMTEVDMLRNRAVRPWAWATAMGGLVGAFVLALAVSRQLQRQAEDQRGRRRRAAYTSAMQSLKEIAGVDARKRAGKLGQTFATAVADVAGSDAEGLTTADVVRQLQEWNLSSDLVSRIADFLAECDAARYGGSSLATGDGVDRAQSLHESLFKLLREKKLLK